MVELQTRPLFLELDLLSEQGRALLQSVADRYGQKIVDATKLAGRIFMLRSPLARGCGRRSSGGSPPEPEAIHRYRET